MGGRTYPPLRRCKCPRGRVEPTSRAFSLPRAISRRLRAILFWGQPQLLAVGALGAGDCVARRSWDNGGPALLPSRVAGPMQGGGQSRRAWRYVREPNSRERQLHGPAKHQEDSRSPPTRLYLPLPGRAKPRDTGPVRPTPSGQVPESTLAPSRRTSLASPATCLAGAPSGSSKLGSLLPRERGGLFFVCSAGLGNAYTPRNTNPEENPMYNQLRGSSALASLDSAPAAGSRREPQRAALIPARGPAAAVGAGP